MSEKPTAGLAGVEKVVPINAIRPNPWNPNVMSEFMFEKERASIREFGFIDPILVREQPRATRSSRSSTASTDGRPRSSKVSPRSRSRTSVA